MNPNILLVTTNNANNYGAALQAFALRQKLSKFGRVTTLNYDNRYIGSSMDYIRFKPSLHGLLGLAKDLLRVRPRVLAINKFKSFGEKHLSLSPPISKTALSENEMLEYDVFVSGSDQIWNPRCTNASGEIDETYFLGFAPHGKKKVSYASSWGGFQPTPLEQETISRLLSDYS